MATATPATRITAANFSENDAPRQAPVNHRTPLMAMSQSERRTRTSAAIAIAVATSSIDSVMT